MKKVKTKLHFNTPLKIEAAYLIKERKGVAIIILQLSERCDTSGYSVGFGKEDDSIALDVDFKKGGKDKIYDDAIELPEYKGWHIFSAQAWKRDIHICLIDDYEEKEEPK